MIDHDLIVSITTPVFNFELYIFNAVHFPLYYSPQFHLLVSSSINRTSESSTQPQLVYFHPALRSAYSSGSVFPTVPPGRQGPGVL